MKAWLPAILVLGMPLAVNAAEAAAVPPPATEAPSGEAPLTLAQALSTALQVSPRLEVARSGIDAARAQLRAARAQGRPSVELDVNARYQGPARSIFGNNLPSAPGQPGGPPSFLQGLPGGGVLNPNRALEPQVLATVPLYTGGRVSAGKRGARAAERAALIREQGEAQTLVFDVTAAYLDTLEARQQTDLAGALRELDVERLQVARVKQRAGAGIPLEVSQAEADLAGAVQQEIEARARVGESGAALNTLIGRPAGAALVLVSVPVAPPARPGQTETPTAPASPPPTPEQLQALGLERPELRALREDARRAQAQVDVARANRRPLVNLRASYLRRLPETLLGNFAWSLGASLVQSLFDAGRSRSQVEAARAERDRVGGGVKEAERRTEEQVEQSRLALEAAEQRQAAEDRRSTAAAEALEVARTRRRAGTAAPIEVTEAQTTLLRAQTDALAARYEAARARVRLAYVIGTAYPETVTSAARQ